MENTKLTIKDMQQFFNNKGITPRHDLNRLKKSINKACRVMNVSDKYNAFLYVIGFYNFPGFTSYGFDTESGRMFQNLVSDYYHYNFAE